MESKEEGKVSGCCEVFCGTVCIIQRCELIDAWVLGGKGVVGKESYKGGSLLFVYNIHAGHVQVIHYLPAQLDLGYASA